jgi:hypothetical protein
MADILGFFHWTLKINVLSYKREKTKLLYSTKIIEARTEFLKCRHWIFVLFWYKRAKMVRQKVGKSAKNGGEKDSSGHSVWLYCFAAYHC